jgi:hypothetical protein|tara:strand:- start:10911 stop:11573 length:663 start_codon:yes stop_codon:yes gene_type:complete
MSINVDFNVLQKLENEGDDIFCGNCSEDAYEMGEKYRHIISGLNDVVTELLTEIQNFTENEETKNGLKYTDIKNYVYPMKSFNDRRKRRDAVGYRMYCPHCSESIDSEYNYTEQRPTAICTTCGRKSYYINPDFNIQEAFLSEDSTNLVYHCTKHGERVPTQKYIFWLDGKLKEYVLNDCDEIPQYNGDKFDNGYHTIEHMKWLEQQLLTPSNQTRKDLF